MRADLATPYNWTTHKPDENSADFKAVMNWLVARGAPRPTVLNIQLDSAGWQYPGTGTFPGSVMYLNFAGDPLPHDAARVLNGPGVLLKELGLTKDDIEYTVAPPPPPVKIPVTTHIGPRLNANWYTQIEPETDPAQDGDPVTGQDGRTYIFRKGMIGGWYELVRT